MTLLKLIINLDLGLFCFWMNMFFLIIFAMHFKNVTGMDETQKLIILDSLGKCVINGFLCFGYIWIPAYLKSIYIDCFWCCCQLVFYEFILGIKHISLNRLYKILFVKNNKTSLQD